MNLYQYCGNNGVNWVDPWGLNFWTLFDEDHFTHIGSIVGRDGSYTYYSYGPEGMPKPSGEGYITQRPFSTIDEAMAFAKKQGYDKFAEYEITKCDDERARNAAKKFMEDDSYYEVLQHNCASFVNAMAEATTTLVGIWRGYRAPWWAFGLNRKIPYLRNEGNIH